MCQLGTFSVHIQIQGAIAATIMYKTISPEAREEIRRFNRPCPDYEKPELIGYYSRTGSPEPQYSGNDRSLMTFFDESRFRMDERDAYRYDLNQLREMFSPTDASPMPSMRSILRCILDHRKKLQSEDMVGTSRLDVDFVTRHTTLRFVMTSLYEGSWHFQAVKFNGTIYLGVCKAASFTLDPVLKVQDKFRKCMVTDEPTKEKAPVSLDPNDASQIRANNGENFYCLYKSRLGLHSIAFSARSSGFELSEEAQKSQKSKEDLDLANDGYFTQFKATRFWYTSEIRKRFWTSKAVKYWANGFLIGTQKLIVGFRNNRDEISSLQSMDCESLPHLAFRNRAFWSHRVCVNFLDTLLTDIKAQVQKELTVYTINFDGEQSQKVHIEETDKPQFLPDWFLEA